MNEHEMKKLTYDIPELRTVQSPEHVILYDS